MTIIYRSICSFAKLIINDLADTQLYKRGLHSDYDLNLNKDFLLLILIFESLCINVLNKIYSKLNIF